jgi:thiol:disulfide interchange protein
MKPERRSALRLSFPTPTALTLAALMVAGALVAAPLFAPPAAAQGFLDAEPRAELELAADHTSYAPGYPARIAARVTIEDGWHINSHEPTFEWLIPTRLRLELPEGWAEPTLTYPEHEMQTFGFADEAVAVYDGEVVILAELTVPEGVTEDSMTIEGVLGYQACDHDSCDPPNEARASLELTLGGMGEPANEALFAKDDGDTTGAFAGGRPGDPSLAGMLLLGVLGGLILNLMPCVLPVLSLKVFGLVKSAGQGRGAMTGGALATAAGILLSFLGLAVAAILARQAGAAVGWGVQFQNPAFVIFLLVVVVLFCLNLWGLFEIPLPRFVARAASATGGAGGREGVVGHLFSGFFATLMATPCSAPFLGTAIAFALAQPAPTIIAIFAAVGVGMALPYLVLAVVPGAAGLLPKPGPWMDGLRRVMGFFLAAAAVWLLYVLGSQVSLESRAWIELTLLGIALMVWMQHRLRTGGSRGPWLRRGAGFGVVALAVVALLVGVRADEARASGSLDLDEAVEGKIAWIEFDRAAAEEMAAAGRLVFVDVTADWCFTCKVNERLVLETEPMRKAFERLDVVAMKADWTNRNDEIGAFLADHGKYGIPFYLLYRPGQEPHVFGELITQEGVIGVLEAAEAEAS